MFRLILGIKMIEVAKELVETVHGWQEFIAIPEMILAELSGCVSLRLQKFGDRRLLAGQSFFRPGQTDFQEPGPQRTLPGDKGGAAGGAGLLSIIIGENGAFV